MGPYIVCLVTIDDMDKASRIARKVVESKLAACVNIIPELRSIYSWQGRICDEREYLMIVKTRAELFDQLRDTVKQLHPYEVPEIIALDITQGLPEYLKWIDDSTT
ncbi:MAG: divalent-cation tolerance protein CutA [Desulfomonile tiedjei]|nr:divalent-cation tolerance protein CutA [Desulfomonile tiedjei]